MERFKNRPALIETERLTLRPFTDADLEDCLAIIRSTDVNRTYMLPDFPDRESAVRLFERLKTFSQGNRFIYAVCLNDRMIGFFNDVEIEGGMIELGWAMNPAFWNKGYASEALRALISVLFGLGFTTVRGGWFEMNPASGRVMEKAGMELISRVDELEYRGKTHRCFYREARCNE